MALLPCLILTISAYQLFVRRLAAQRRVPMSSPDRLYPLVEGKTKAETRETPAGRDQQKRVASKKGEDTGTLK